MEINNTYKKENIEILILFFILIALFFLLLAMILVTSPKERCSRKINGYDDSTEENYTDEEDYNNKFITGRYITIENATQVIDPESIKTYGKYIPLNIGSIEVYTLSSPYNDIISTNTNKVKIHSFTGGEMKNFPWKNILLGKKDKLYFGHSAIPVNEIPSVTIDLGEDTQITKIIIYNRKDGYGTRIYNSTLSIKDNLEKITFQTENKIWGEPLLHETQTYVWKKEDDEFKGSDFFTLELTQKKFIPGNLKQQC